MGGAWHCLRRHPAVDLATNGACQRNSSLRLHVVRGTARLTPAQPNLSRLVHAPANTPGRRCRCLGGARGVIEDSADNRGWPQTGASRSAQTHVRARSRPPSPPPPRPPPRLAAGMYRRLTTKSCKRPHTRQHAALPATAAVATDAGTPAVAALDVDGRLPAVTAATTCSVIDKREGIPHAQNAAHRDMAVITNSNSRSASAGGSGGAGRHALHTAQSMQPPRSSTLLLPLTPGASPSAAVATRSIATTPPSTPSSPSKGRGPAATPPPPAAPPAPPRGPTVPPAASSAPRR